MRLARLLILAITIRAGAAAAEPPGLPPPPVGETITECWLEARTFDTLRAGPFSYCRKNLRYRPGLLECYWVAERVCWVYFPASRTSSGTWAQTHALEAPIAFPCPFGPEPPVCPRLAGL